MSARDDLLEWHRRTANVAGQMSLRAETSGLSDYQLVEWMTELESISGSIRRFRTDRDRKAARAASSQG